LQRQGKRKAVLATGALMIRRRRRRRRRRNVYSKLTS